MDGTARVSVHASLNGNADLGASTVAHNIYILASDILLKNRKDR